MPPLDELLPLLKPDMPQAQDLLPYLQRMDESGQYSNFGPLVRELEQAMARYFGTRSDLPLEVVTVANGTQGLELVLQALALPRQARVLMPSFTFVATATAVCRAGCVPVLCDVDAGSWLLTPEIAQAACARTRVDAVMPVAAFGLPHDMAAWNRFEQDTGCPVVVDAAAAFGGQWLQGPAHGTLVFSLHATKSLPAGEGGLVVSTRPGLIDRIRELANFGINMRPGGAVSVGALVQLGSNAKMSEYHAAVALASLGGWEERAAVRQGLATALRAELDVVADGRLRWQEPTLAGPVAAPMGFCVRLPDEASRDRLEALCAQSRISTRRWYQPVLGTLPILADRSVALETPVAHALGRDLLGLPFFLKMGESDRRRLRTVMRQLFGG